jgi:hypothetical protein
VPKDTQRTATTDHPQLEPPEQVTLAVAELAGAAREGLLALAVGTGLQVLQTLLAADVGRLVGAKGRHNPDRTAARHGSDPGQVTLGGRRVRLRRPRVRSAEGTREVAVPTYQAFAATDLLGQLALERMLAKLSTRRYPAGLEPVGTQVAQVAAATSKSAVSRRTEQAPASCSPPTCPPWSWSRSWWTGSASPTTPAWSHSASPSTAPDPARPGRGRHRERHHRRRAAGRAARAWPGGHPAHPGGDRRRQGATPRGDRGVRPPGHPALPAPQAPQRR